MAIRKIALKALILSTVVIFSLVSHAYLINKYNSETVEFYYRGDAFKEKVFEVIQDNKMLGVINYTMPYQSFRLTMTTGCDNMTENIEVVKGAYINDLDKREVVIGDKVADRYFRTINVLGQSVLIQGRKYDVIGVIKNSKDIYIPFDNNLKKLDWQKKKIKINIADEKSLNILIEKLQGQLSALGVDIYDTITRKNVIRSYDNIAALAILYSLVMIAYRLIKGINADVLKLKRDYKEKRRVIELHMYLLQSYVDVLRITGMFLLTAAAAFGLYEVLTKLYLSHLLIPNNLFSPISYINVLKLNYEVYLMRLHNGVDGILIDAKRINTCFTALFAVALVLAFRYKNKEYKTKINH